MRWVARTETDTANQTLDKRLWAAADQFRANSGLKAGQYSTPVLGLIFLRFAEARFAQRRAQLEKAGTSARRGTSRIDDPKAYMAEGVLYLTPRVLFEHVYEAYRGEGASIFSDAA
jgi:type I restriction enzyme M protein